MGISESAAVVRAIRLERRLIRIRWFAVALGTYQVLGSYRALVPTPVPEHVRPVGVGLLAMLAVCNVALLRALDGEPGPRRVRIAGATAFAVDATALFTFSWLYTFNPDSLVWITMFILPLEGAMRYGLHGALLPVAIALPLELGREAFLAGTFDRAFDISDVTFRVGIMAIIGAVSGTTTSELRSERIKAETQAAEIEAFHAVVIAGASGKSFEESVERIVEAMASSFGYEIFAIGLLERDDTDPDADLMRCIGAHGLPRESIGLAVGRGSGVVWRAADTGRAQLVTDTTTDDDYLPLGRAGRSEMVVPIQARGRTIGVVNVEASEPNAFSVEDLGRLERLASQIGLIISNAELLDKERDTVDRLTQLDDMRADFVAITSHELRTPLTAISGFIKTLRRPGLVSTWEEADKYLDMVDRQADRLIAIVEDLLAVSHIEAGMLQLRWAGVEPGAFLRELTASMPDASRVRIDAGGSPGTLVTDPQRLGQVVRNLIDNALKYSDGGDVVVRTWQTGDQHTFEVADSGPGIPPEEHERVFERFHQVGGANARRGGGVGLGLYITRQLVDALGGSIELDSAVGRGTTFRIRMPSRAAEAPQMTA